MITSNKNKNRIYPSKNTKRQGRIKTTVFRKEEKNSDPKKNKKVSYKSKTRSHLPFLGTHLKKPDVIPPLKDGDIRIIPLGGVEEIGRNMTIIEYKDDIIIIDAGLEFADEDTPGIDYIIPNTEYLEKRRSNIRGIIITHGHLDHIGAIPYIVNRLGNPPIYTMEFAALLIKKRQEEFPNLPKLDLKIIKDTNEIIVLGENLKFRFFGVTHAIPDSNGIIIETPYGDIVNTGDIRVETLNNKPVKEEVDQYNFFKKRKILLLTMDSTGIDRPGWSVPEFGIRNTIDKIISETKGRLIIATFASQVERIIEFMKMAKKYNRKVIIEGRSMKTIIAIIQQLNLINTDHLIPISEIQNYPVNKILIIATGAQGEEFAALMRMSNKTHRQVHLEKEDTIILSSSIIPGNEGAIAKLKDNLYRHNSKIITYLDSNVHAGGHGKYEDLKWVHEQINYKFFMPVHGHHYMVKIHAELARLLGVKEENMVIPENGNIVEIREKGTKIIKLKESAPSNMILVDGFSVGGTQNVVIRDRKMLAQDGIFVIVVTIDSKTGHLRKSPDIISRGFVHLKEEQEMLHQSRGVIKKTVEDLTIGMNPINVEYIKSNLIDNVSKFLFQKTAKRPLVIPVFLNI